MRKTSRFVPYAVAFFWLILTVLIMASWWGSTGVWHWVQFFAIFPFLGFTLFGFKVAIFTPDEKIERMRHGEKVRL